MSHAIIGLAGRKRTGKDTFAAVLCDEYGFTRVAFADALKEAALALDPIISPNGPGRVGRLGFYVDMLGWEVAKEHSEVRRTLQRYGVGIRDIDPRFWIRAAERAIQAADGPVVITDVRFQNEADAVEDMGGFVIRLTRPGLDMSDSHASEAGVDALDVGIDIANDSDVEALRRVARAFGQAVADERATV